MRYQYMDENRRGDHICYISDLSKMKAHYPKWGITKNLKTMFEEISQSWLERSGNRVRSVNHRGSRKAGGCFGGASNWYSHSAPARTTKMTSARLWGTTGHCDSTNQGTKSHIQYPIRVIAEGLFSAYVVGRKGDRYGHYDLRLGRHAPRAHRPRPQTSRPAGSRASSVGSIDDQAIATARTFLQ